MAKQFFFSHDSLAIAFPNTKQAYGSLWRENFLSMSVSKELGTYPSLTR